MSIPLRRSLHASMRPFTALLLVQAVSAHALGAQTARTAVPDNLFDYDRAPIAVVRESAAETVDGVRETLVLLSAGGRDTITARLYAPVAFTSRQPAMIMGHGAPGSGANAGPRARYFARHAAVVLVVDAPFVKRDQNAPITMTAQDSIELVQQVIHYRRAFDYLASRRDVDAARIGFVGGSHSAYVGALLAGAERRLRAVALAMGDVGYVEHFRDADGAWSRQFPAELSEDRIARWVESLRPLDGATWLSRARVQHLLLQNALEDEAVPRHAAIKLHAAAPPGALHEWYNSGHRVTADAYFSQLQFFSRTLGLTSPTLSDEHGPYPEARTSPAPARSVFERPSAAASR